MSAAASPLPVDDPRGQDAQAAERWMAEVVRAELEVQEPRARRAARVLAAPRWFNLELMRALMGEWLSPDEAADLLDQMRGWPFVRGLGGGRYMYREGARAALLGPYPQAGGLVEIHALAHNFFDQQLKAAGFDTLDEQVWMRLRPEMYNALREKVYHLLRVDAERGYALFRVLFRGAHAWYLPGEAEALLHTLDGMQVGALAQPQRDELAFFEAIQAAADYRYSEAEERLNNLLARPLEPELRARVLGELGKLLASSRRLEPAVEAFRAAQAAFQAIGRRRESAAVANNMGSVFLELRRSREAREVFQWALRELREFGSPGDVAQAFNNLGTAYEREEEWARALEHYQTSLEMKTQIGDSFGAARTQANIGSIYHAQIRDTDDARRAARLRDSARDLYAQSLEVFQQFGARSEAARVQFKQALLDYQSGEMGRVRASLPFVLDEYRALGIPGVENVERLAKHVDEQAGGGG